MTATLVSSLRSRIESGHYPAGSRLPAERDLATEFGVARRSVRSAIALLAEEGLVQCRSGFRPVIQPPPLPRAKPGADASPSSVAIRPPDRRLVALVMWHGPPVAQAAAVEQRIFWGMNERLAQEGLHSVFLNLGTTVGSEEENAAREAANLTYACDQGFAGIIFYPYAYRSNLELIQETLRHLPLILIDRMVPGIQADYVGIDNRGAMRDLTRHLLEQGHRRIVFATRAEPINTVQDRLSGYREVIEEAGLPEYIVVAPGTRDVSNWTAMDGLFALPPEERPTAVLCINDYTALLAYTRLTYLGLQVPTDVAIAGFDDIIPVLPNGVSLTTVAQPFEAIGRTAAEALLARRSRPWADAVTAANLWRRELPTTLLIRTSTSGFGTWSPPEEKTPVLVSLVS